MIKNKKNVLKKINKKMSLSFIGALAASVLLAACSHQNNEFEHKLVFSIAQSQVYPMAIALKDVVPLYNEQQKDTEGFLPVSLLTTEDNKLSSESALLNDAISKINTNDPATPSLILNANTAAATVHAYNKLLDVSSVLTAKDFAPSLNALYTQTTGALTGQNGERLFALPYNVSTTESLAINAKVLKYLVDLAKEAGATVATATPGTYVTSAMTTAAKAIASPEEKAASEQNNAETDANKKTAAEAKFKEDHPNYGIDPFTNDSIIKALASVTETKENLLDKELKDTVWTRYEVATADKATTTDGSTTGGKLAGYTISDDTFKTYDKLSEFAKKIGSILSLKKDAADNSKTITLGENDPFANILSIDYSSNLVSRRAWELTGSNQTDYLWNYKKSGDSQNQVQVVDYIFLGQPTSTSKKAATKQSSFESAWDDINASFGLPDKTKKLRDVFYTQNTNDWGSWLLRTFDTAVAIVPNVGIRQSVQSNLSKAFFATENGWVDQDKFDKFAKLNTDVQWFHQYTMTKKAASADEQQLSTYIAGGSSLIPISVNAEKDAALKSFLSWIYKGNVTLKDNKTMPVADYIEQLSGYFIPSAQHFGTEAAVRDRIMNYRKLAASNTSDDLQFTYKSLELSAQDYLLYLLEQKNAPYKDNNNKFVLLNSAGDVNTGLINGWISNYLKQMSTKDATQKMSGSEVMQALKDRSSHLIK